MSGTEEHPVEEKIERVEEIRTQLEQAETMDPVTAKQLHDEAMTLLAEIEEEIDMGGGEVVQKGESTKAD